MSAGGGRAGRRILDLTLSIVALAVGLPGCAGLLLGTPLADWSIPLRPQLGGEFALKTVVYLSGFLASFGAIGLVWRLWDAGTDGSLAAPPLTRGARGDSASPGSTDTSASGADPEAGAGASPYANDPGVIATRTAASADHTSDGSVSLGEPFYGFLPRDEQLRLARQTGYHALLFTRISILMLAAVGVLLAGSWEPPSLSQAFPQDVAIRIGAGLYLMAESVRRYLRFMKGEPTGSLIGTLVHGALRPLRRGGKTGG